MGVTAGKALVGISFDPADIARLEASADGIGRKVAKDMDKSTSRFQRFGGAVKAAGKYAALASIPIAGALVIGIKKSIEAASESEQAQLRLRKAVENTGGSYQDSTRILDDLQRKQFSVAISDERLADAYSKILTSTGKVNLSQKGLNAALDVAAARNIDLNTAALAVGKALAGQTTSLQRLGIHLDANASKTEVLAALQERFGGAAVRQATGAAGALQKVGLALDELEETAGRAFLPLIKSLGDWLSKTQNQQKAQETLKKIMADTAAVAKFLASGIAFVSRNWDRFIILIKLSNLVLTIQYEGIKKLIAVYPTLKSVAVTAGNLIRSAWSAVRSVISTIKGIIDSIVGAFRSAKSSGSQAGNAIRSAWNGLAGVISSALGPILSIVSALQSAYSAAQSIIGLGGHGAAPAGNVQGTGRYGAVVGHRAAGGPVMSGSPYLVGERGPEVFVPRVSGRIIPNGGGGGNNITVYIGNEAVEPHLVRVVDTAFDQLGQYVATRPGR